RSGSRTSSGRERAGFRRRSPEPRDERLERGEERSGRSAVDRAVVEGETGLHRRAGCDRAVCEHDGPVADAADPEEAALRRVEDRGRDVDRMDSAVRDGEGAGGDVVGGERAVTGARGELGDQAFDCRTSVHVTQTQYMDDVVV